MRQIAKALSVLLVSWPLYLFSDQISSINVITATATKLPVNEQVETFGNLAAVNQVTISSQVAGNVTNIFFKDGQNINEGALILQLDNTQAKADLISAQADLALSKRNYQRYEELAKYGGTTKQQLDSAQADVNAKEASLQQTFNALQKYTLTAPFTGRLSSFLVQEGDYVTAGSQLVTIVNNNPLKVLYALPENTFPKLKLNQTVMINPAPLPNQSFSGKVTYIAPTIDTNTGTISVQATLENKSGELSPGMFATLKQIFGQTESLVIPEECVLANIQGTYVYKVIAGKAVQTPVKTGDSIQGYIEIESGLAVGDTVITEGQQKLSNGSVVTVVGKWTDKHTVEKSLTVRKTMANVDHPVKS